MPLFPFSRMRKRTWIRIVKTGSFKGGRQFIRKPSWGASLRPRAERRWRRERKTRLPHQAAATDGHSRPCSLQLFPSHGISGGEEGERIMRFSKAWSSGAHYPAVSRGGDFPPFPRQRRRGRYSSPFTPFHASSPRYAGSAGSLLSGCLDSCPGGMARHSLSGPHASPRVNGRGRERGSSRRSAGRVRRPLPRDFSPLSPPRPFGCASGGNLPRIRRPTPRFF